MAAQYECWPEERALSLLPKTRLPAAAHVQAACRPSPANHPGAAAVPRRLRLLLLLNRHALL